VSALAVVLYTVGMSAQAPSFAGKWTLDPASAPAPPAGGGGGGGRGGGRGGGGAVSGMEVTIMQDATSLTINKTAGGQTPAPVTLKYTLDGKDSKNKVMGRGGEVETTSQATMAAGKITITTTADMGRGPTTTKQVLSIEGGNLVVENMGADGTSMGKLTYKKGM
jgi:hypothetical protein